MPSKPTTFSLALAARRVDTAARSLRDVVILEADREASGHGIYIDAKTVAGVLESIGRDYGGKLRAYWTHEGREDDLNAAGYFDQFRIDGNRLIAGKFEFFEAFEKANPGIVAQALEMAEKTPELIALSIEASGHLVFIDEAGQEWTEPERAGMDPAGLLYDGLPVFRCTRCTGAAFVADGAATKSLFSAMLARVLGRRKKAPAKAAPGPVRLHKKRPIPAALRARIEAVVKAFDPVLHLDLKADRITPRKALDRVVTIREAVLAAKKSALAARDDEIAELKIRTAAVLAGDAAHDHELLGPDGFARLSKNLEPRTVEFIRRHASPMALANEQFHARLAQVMGPGAERFFAKLSEHADVVPLRVYR